MWANRNKERPVTKAIVNGKTIRYDACAEAADTTLEAAKKAYKHFDYVGESDGIILNGWHQFKGEKHYIFVYKECK